MCDYPFFIPQVVLFANSSLFWFKVTNEHREFRNYLYINKIEIFLLLFTHMCPVTGFYSIFRPLRPLLPAEAPSVLPWTPPASSCLRKVRI